MDLEKDICQGIIQAFEKQFGQTVDAEKITLQPTRKDFEGTYTFVLFPFLKMMRKKPEEAGQIIGEFLKENIASVADFNVVKGFLNLVISDQIWIETLRNIMQNPDFGFQATNGEKVMVEYSSPNTNKPLHLGHMRNNFLGYSLANIVKANGYEVLKTNLVNDRGIHICKSMLAYEKFGNGETPNENLKGDKLVGNYYVKFDKEYKKEIQALLEQYQQEEPNAKGDELKKKAEKNAPLLLEAQEILRKWEKGDEATVALWKKMNGWVYDGFDQTYQLMGVNFDKTMYESETYLLGKNIVEEGLMQDLFYQKEDGSVWVDLTSDGLDEKLLLRKDGTSVYMTQDMGTADLKYKAFPMQKSVYVVGNEQEYHFKVLKLIMQKLGRSYADGIYHMSYGMVDLPSGKMKSREGTVVDADDLVYEMRDIAKARTSEQGKIDDFGSKEADNLYLSLALGALKYYLLRVDPRKRILFNPEESIDFQGNTGVYIQYNHARLCAIIRHAETEKVAFGADSFQHLEKLDASEIELVSLLSNFPNKIQESANAYAPSIIANYIYELAKTYSKFYAELSIFNAETEESKSLRISLSATVANVLKKGLNLLGIDAPERM